MGSSSTIWGNVVYDPKLNGQVDQVVKFTLCVPRNNGKGKDYCDVTIRSGKHADAVVECVKKGMFVVVSGDLQTEYVDSTGKKRKNTEYTNAAVAWSTAEKKLLELAVHTARTVNQVCQECVPKDCDSCVLKDLSRRYEAHFTKEEE